MLFALCALLFQVPGDPPTISSTIDSAVKGSSGFTGTYIGKPASDEALLKRLYKDLFDSAPTDADLKAFIADQNPRKRVPLIDALLLDDRFDAYWAKRFTAVFFKPDADPALTAPFQHWLHAEIKKDTPWTDIVYRILNARGTLATTPELAYLLSFRSDPAAEFPQGVAKHFLGIRLYCAKCHDHPRDRWRVEDFYGLASFFNGAQFAQEKLDYTDAGDATMPSFTGHETAEVKFAAGGKAPALFFWGGTLPAGADRMTTLATLMTQRATTQLPRMLVNRVWGWIFGHGIVHPIDDFGLKNKAMAPGLLEAMVRDSIENKYSLKRLVRIILNTQAYQMASKEESPEAYGIRQYLDIRYALGDYGVPGQKTPPGPLDYTLPDSWTRVRKLVMDHSGARNLYRALDPKDATRVAELWVYEGKDSGILCVPGERQYVRPKKSTTALAGKLPTTIYELSGTWTCCTGADGPVEWTVLTATLEAPKGPSAFRLEGPPATVAACRADFEAMLKTVAPR